MTRRERWEGLLLFTMCFSPVLVFVGLTALAMWLSPAIPGCAQ